MKQKRKVNKMKQNKTFQYITIVLLAAVFLLSIATIYDKNTDYKYIQIAEEGNSVQVEGQAQGEYEPELFKVNIGVQQEGNNPTQLENEVTSTTNDVIDALLNAGITEDDIKRQTYNLNPQSSFQRDRSGNQYMASQTLHLEVKDISLINDVLRVAVDAGANNIGSLSFDLTEETKEEVKQELIQEAVNNARNQAENAVSATGKSLGDPKNIQVDQRFNIYRAGSFDAAMESGPDSSPNIQPGFVEQNANVRISYKIE